MEIDNIWSGITQLASWSGPLHFISLDRQIIMALWNHQRFILSHATHHCFCLGRGEHDNGLLGTAHFRRCMLLGSNE